MRRSLASLVGIAVAMTVSVPANGLQSIVESSALPDILDSINQDGSTSIDVNEDQYLNSDDWTVPVGEGAVGAAIETGDTGPPLTFGVYDFADSAKRVGLLQTGAPEGAGFILSILDDGTVFVDNGPTGVTFAANRFGFFLTDGVTTRYSDWHLNPEMGVHAIFFAGNGDVLFVEGLAPQRFSPGMWIIAWEFGDLAEGTRYFDDFVVLIDAIRPAEEVPEPGTLALLGLGLLGLGVTRRKAN